jgi:hypothetical protein
MKARITDKSELSLNLKQHYTFDIIGDNEETVLGSQTIECSPSQAIVEITNKISEYQTEYELSQDIPEVIG